MSPLQKHAKLIRFSRPACRPSLLLSAQGRGRRSGSFWEPLPRSSVPLEWYNSDIIASSHSCRMISLRLCPQWLLKDGRRKNSPIRDGFLNCKDFSSFNPTMTSEQGFHDGSTSPPLPKPPAAQQMASFNCNLYFPRWHISECRFTQGRGKHAQA